MTMHLTDQTIAQDLEFIGDIRGKILFVKWRCIPVGSIDQVQRQRGISPEIRKKHKGEWYDPWNVNGFYDTKEAAACDLVRGYVERNADHEVVLAAIRKDYDAVEKWLNEAKERYPIEFENDQ